MSAIKTPYRLIGLVLLALAWLLMRPLVVLLRERDPPED